MNVLLSTLKSCMVLAFGIFTTWSRLSNFTKLNNSDRFWTVCFQNAKL